jgi:hypothetical protein
MELQQSSKVAPLLRINQKIIDKIFGSALVQQQGFALR